MMHTSPRYLRPVLTVLAVAFIAGSLGLGSPAPAAASTETSMESSLASWINRDRTARGLVPLRVDSRLYGLAGERSSWMASQGTLTHDSVDGTISEAYTARSIAWYSCGEDIAMTTYPWGSQAAAAIYSMWKHSSTHWALLMSSRYNYMGIGVAFRSATGATYASVALLEGPDRTPPYAGMVSAGRSGTTIKFTWRGFDRKLQTHTAGLANFDVLYRVDSGTWRVIRSATTTTSITIYNRPHGHYYWLRVRARDKRGNLSTWSSALRIWVP